MSEQTLGALLRRVERQLKIDDTRYRMRHLNATPAGRYRRAQRVCRLQLARITATIAERYAMEQCNGQ